MDRRLVLLDLELGRLYLGDGSLYQSLPGLQVLLDESKRGLGLIQGLPERLPLCLLHSLDDGGWRWYYII